MTNQPKVQLNFNAPVTGVAGNVEGDQIIHNYAPQANLKETEQLTQVLQQLRQQNPNATDAELFEILLNGFQTMPQKNPQNWQSWQNILSILFAGGVESIKLICPPAGIPIEVGKRLYDIYQKNQKQLPGNWTTHHGDSPMTVKELLLQEIETATEAQLA